jgi:hypothetical protein
LLGAKDQSFDFLTFGSLLESQNFWITGMANAAVFPEPVLALTRTSLPSRSKGIALSCIKVGACHPNFAMALRNKNEKVILTSNCF